MTNAPVAQRRTEHEVSTLGIAGSIPAGRANPEQHQLPLGDLPTDTDPMREAYERSPALKKQFPTFEQAIADPLRKKGLANEAELIMKRRAGLLALIPPIPLPPVSDDGFAIAIILAVLAGGVIGCILTLIRRKP